MKSKKIKILISILIIVLIISIVLLIVFRKNSTELKTIASEKQLERIYNNDTDYSTTNKILINIVAMPFNIISGIFNGYFEPIIPIESNYYDKYITDGFIPQTVTIDSSASVAESAQKNSLNSSSSSSKDYSTTNIQVENVDEADITKTDGDYIYSLSENNVIITDVRIPENIKIASKISSYGSIPEDLILYQNKLVVISASTSSSSYHQNTVVEVFDITNKEKPVKVKSYTLYEPYYTSRCIDNNLYVISSGNLRKEDNEIARYYTEGSVQKEIALDKIKYLKDIKTNKQTLISNIDLDNINADVNVNSYLIDISNCYVSENGIYLLNENYNYDSNIPPISTLFSFAGAFGPFLYEEYNNSSSYKTEIYKFDILDDGSIKYASKAKVNGQTINQYSLDEYNGNLRVALYDNNGSRVVIFDNNLNKIGESANVAKGEKMYSSLFIGDKLYFVTFKNMDPLFVVDLSDPTSPKVLGELKIPGYSTYLHSYDENHLIGIGMQTEEFINRNSSGKVVSSGARITGMKMALFDISNVNNPIEISNIVIGDSRTTSAILTNPKALLFSKEKELIAIPVNNYSDDFEISYSDSTSSVISSYTNNSKSYLSEGYLVYKINLEDGFNLKGLITHDNAETSYYYNTNSRLLRGLYIDDNLFTVSETAVKVNKLDDLKQISELKIINKED
ncbi:MAG: beta-propeller domain-containing protein [Clostridia bacterium]